MSMMRVLQVFTVMDRGGAESMIMNYYRSIDRDKVQFDFLVHRKEKGAFDEEIDSLGGKIFRMNPISPFFPNKYYEELRKFFKEHTEYTVVHSHLNTFSCFPLKIAKECNIPCRIAHAHIALDKVSLGTFFAQKESLKEILKKVVKFRLKKRIKNDATHYFSCGEKAGKWLFGSTTSFIMMNNAIDAKKFSYNKVTAAEYKKEFNVEDEIIIGHVGRFSSQKNHAFLLQIFAALLKKNANYQLVLIGDGPLKNAMEKEAKNLSIDKQVHFLGVRTDIPQLYQLLDLFVFPSFYEGLPVTLIEAQAAGLKILASDTITKEVHLTDDIAFLSIEKPAEFWADTILETAPSEKKDNTELIVDKHYDIVSNTQKMQEFYLQQSSI